MLLFRLDGKQLYGINVFKVREVLQCPKLTIMPKSSPVVCGVANIRGATIPILDLCIGHEFGRPARREKPVCDHYRIQHQDPGFPGALVERIVNMTGKRSIRRPRAPVAITTSRR